MRRSINPEPNGRTGGPISDKRCVKINGDEFESIRVVDFLALLKRSSKSDPMPYRKKYENIADALHNEGIVEYDSNGTWYPTIDIEKLDQLIADLIAAEYS